MKKKTLKKFFGVFEHFLQTNEVAQFLMIKLRLDVSDVIHKSEHTKYENCGLHVNFWIFLLMSFCLMTEKDHFKQKLSL